MDETVTRAETAVTSGTYVQHMAINAAKLVHMHNDPELRAVVEECDLVTADGQAVVWASRVLGDPLPERIAGVDLMMRLLELSARRGYRVFILGAKRDVLDAAIAELLRRHPQLQIAGARDGYFSESEWGEVAREIRDARPDLLFVAISSPTKELFLGRHGRDLGVPFVMGVGGAIDIVAGITRRAPALWQRLGLEWLFRLLQEPRRMARRYLTTNVLFLLAVARARLSKNRI
jgi:N-acetylglucosaminyldiphosphoundecaprenol N-acetyl-beta-D-mannosaminyltransferase